MNTKSKLPNINNFIKATTVRVIGPNKDQLGIMSISEALELAKKFKLDLVEVSPNASPSVCSLMNFGRYKYDLKKKIQSAKKKQSKIEVKEIKLRPNIGESDFHIKLTRIIKFLSSGNKVKVSVWFRGRELSYTDIGKELLMRVKDHTKEISKVEQDIAMEGRNSMLMILSSIKK